MMPADAAVNVTVHMLASQSISHGIGDLRMARRGLPRKYGGTYRKPPKGIYAAFIKAVRIAAEKMRAEGGEQK